jgi:DNA polymerase-4
VGEQAPTVVGDHTFGEDTNDVAHVQAALQLLAEHAGHALREQHQMAQRVGVMLDYSDGVRVVRQATPPRPTANDFTLFDHARRALDMAWTRRVRLRHLRVLCDRLCFPPAQLDLFGESTPTDARREGLVTAMDRIRGRFGNDAIHLGRSLAALS